MWCPSCIIMTNRLQKIVSADPSLDLVQYDFDLDIKMVEKYVPGKILPLVVLEKGGKELIRFSGELSQKDIMKKIGEYK